MEVYAIRGSTFTFVDGSTQKYPDGSIMSGENILQTTFLIGGNPYTFRDGEQLYFHPNGVVERGILHFDTNPIPIDNNLFIFPELSSVHFYDNGMVRLGTLKNDSPAHVNGKPYTFKKGSNIAFHPNGVVSEGRLTDDRTVRFTDAGALRN